MCDQAAVCEWALKLRRRRTDLNSYVGEEWGSVTVARV